jgi:extracellular factor (EF) 3-hydroxypalmitic acid methyl ester biosynthesis protein
VVTTQTGHRLLEKTKQELLKYNVNEGMNELIYGLRELRSQMSREDWMSFAGEECTSHPLLGVLLQSPFTKRSFERPRGYAGDAELLDYIYGCAAPIPLSPLGAAIYGWELQSPGCRSVRARRDILTNTLDEVCRRVESPRLLALACGHLREAQASEFVPRGRAEFYAAIDQDLQSLEVVGREQARRNIMPIHGSVKSLLAGKHNFESLDFVYAAGLYDYLSAPLARRLTKVLFSMLSPGGRLLVANFSENAGDIGYMETFMRWNLIFREEPEMDDLMDEIDKEEVSSQRTFRDCLGNIVFLEAFRG